MVPVPNFGTYFFEQIWCDFIPRGGSAIRGQYINLLKYWIFFKKIIINYKLSMILLNILLGRIKEKSSSELGL